MFFLWLAEGGRYHRRRGFSRERCRANGAPTDGITLSCDSSHLERSAAGREGSLHCGEMRF